MSSFLREQKSFIKRNSVLKLISIHIPKTAGRSFYQILSWAYNEKIGIPHNKDMYVVNGRFDESLADMDNVEVLHGHYRFKHIEHIYLKYNAKIVVWLRDPVDRVISNYYYNVNMNLLKPWKKRSELRKEMTLMEFASKPGQQNTMTQFLSGIVPENIFFIGITERFDLDVKKLGELLGWSGDIPQVMENKGTNYYENTEVPTKYDNITDNMRSKIRDLNMDDINLYEKMF